MLQVAVAAKLRERTLGDDVVRALSHAEVGAAVADHHAGAGLVGAMKIGCSMVKTNCDPGKSA